jgi:demethylmenaquinone methyltransferase/2-methoxy-6-polyprenyl-1,4-benzoquinol methylase
MITNKKQEFYQARTSAQEGADMGGLGNAGSSTFFDAKTAVDTGLDIQSRESARIAAFNSIWENDIDKVFVDVARYYDRINIFASLGLLNYLRRRFVSTIDIKPGDKVLDVCAGTNIIGIDLLKKEPGLRVSAIDRSVAMQEAGQNRAKRLGLNIDSTIQDVHRLPYPDNHFNVVTLQYATRHLRAAEVFQEIRRVLKPGGSFYHCDMLRPANKIVEKMYYLFLKPNLTFLSWAFGSSQTSVACINYFIDAIRLYYTTNELTRLLEKLGYTNVKGKSLLGGTIGIHRACKS